MGFIFIQCSKEAGNKGVISQENVASKELTKEDFKKGCIVFDIGVIRDSDNPKKVRGDFSEEIKK